MHFSFLVESKKILCCLQLFSLALSNRGMLEEKKCERCGTIHLHQHEYRDVSTISINTMMWSTRRRTETWTRLSWGNVKSGWKVWKAPLLLGKLINCHRCLTLKVDHFVQVRCEDFSRRVGVSDTKSPIEIMTSNDKRFWYRDAFDRL